MLFRSRYFVPSTDAYETEEGLTLVMEMPGVRRENLEVTLEEGVLKVEGRLDFSRYDDLEPVYTEYNVGNYSRSFRLSSIIDQGRVPPAYREVLAAQRMQVTAAGRAASRSSPIGCPHRWHIPYRPASSRCSAASIAVNCSRAASSSAAACCRSKARVAPSGSCSSSVPAAPAI